MAATTTASSSIPTTTTTTTKFMEKDEQLQLCIQRFVSDTQSMINQFSELFIGELRRFADVCMEFSVSYRNINEDSKFLSEENKSLKDELDARIAEVNFLGKELREIREENDELIRKIECLNINSDGEISMMIHNDTHRSRDYAVVNSMPTFPRRYSSAIGYEPPASSTGSYHHQHNNIEENNNEQQDYNNLSQESSINQKTSFKNMANMLLTPPIPFKTNNNNNNNLINNIEKGSNETSSSSINNYKRSQSRDDISKFHQFNLNNDTNHDSNNNNDNNLDKIPSSLNEINFNDNKQQTIHMIYNKNNGLKEEKTLSTAISSSAGTFYDCSNQIVQLFGKSNENNHNQNNNNQNVGQCTIIDVEFKKHLPIEMTNNQQSSSSPLLLNKQFIAKTPSPSYCDYNQHLNKYYCDNENNNNVKDSNNNVGDVDEFLLNAPPVQRYNSKKLSKKRKSRRKNANENNHDDNEQQHDQQSIMTNIMMPFKCLDNTMPIIPSPIIDLNRYLLVEICHIISPSHFYIIINDEKIGTNAFEDFLERFQNFYKSIELIGQDNDDNDGDDDYDEERQLRLLVSIPPSIHLLTIGSYWACYIDDELDWRRVQIIDRTNLDETNNDSIDINQDEYVMVKDVDSGYSSLVHIQMIRPLINEMAQIPAFAIRSSLAFIYPHHYHHHHNKHQQQQRREEQYYDHWPMECCQFFEDMTYDQILTASVLQINNSNFINNNNNNNLHQSSSLDINLNLNDEIAHVLLWCTSTDDYNEIFINRKLIELNYASNVADNDLWMEQFNDVLINLQPIQQQQQNDLSSNIETSFNIQIINNDNNNNNDDNTSSTFQNQQQQQQNINDKSQIDKKSIKQSNDDESINNNNKQMDRKIKIKTRSKKKKGSLNENKDVNNECQESSINQPVVQIQMIRNIENNEIINDNQQQQQNAIKTEIDPTTTTIIMNNNNKTTCLFSDNHKSNSLSLPLPLPISPSSTSSQSKSPSPTSSPSPSIQTSSNQNPSSQNQSPNCLLQQPIEPIIQICNIEQQHQQFNNIDDDDEQKKLIDYIKRTIYENNNDNNNDDTTKFDHYCHTLHHDPRLSNWILQKHSRHVQLKKTFMPDKISYLIIISCYFEPNKFIGILPYGERKIDNEQLIQFLRFNYCHNNLNEFKTPFYQFILDMTEFYRKEQSLSSISKLKLLPEQCIFEQNNISSIIAFYDQKSGYFLRGHIVCRDMMIEMKKYYDNDLNQHNQNHYYHHQQQQQQQYSEIIKQSKSFKDLFKLSSTTNNNNSDNINNDNNDSDDILMKKKKTSSLRRRSLHDYQTKYIIYAIDVGRYYQVQLKNIYHLDERFKITKPFAIVCKLHGYPNNKNKLSKIHSIIMNNKYFGIRFIDIDFSTERFAVELFTIKLKNENDQSNLPATPTAWRTSSPLISKNLVHLI